MQPSEPRSPGNFQPAPNFQLILEKLSDRGREAFQRDGSSPIEQLVAEAPAEYQEKIFVELLVEEYQLRKMRGETATLEMYRQRFPTRLEFVEKAWREIVSTSPFAPPKSEQSPLSPGESPQFASTVDNDRDDSDAAAAESPGFVADSEDPPQFGPYKVLKSLGAGTFGSVYKAQHETNGKVVAVKMLKSKWARDPECGQAMRQQFADEATMMLQFDHPHVVKVISLDDRADPPYFVQEYIDGETLASRLQTSRPAIEQAVQYAIQIAAGLAHIHSRERWHRDLKPANILLDRNNHVYLADFGLALDDAQRWRSSRGPAGTYPYMAPEQVKGATHRLNARCDIWALGVILYEMLTGRRPFRGETRDQLCDEIIERTPAAPRELDRSIPRELNRLCMQCLSKRDADRPHAAADLQDDLEQILQRLGEGSSSTTAASTSPAAVDTSVSGDSTQPTPVVEYPIPTLKRFTAEQAELYLRLMPRSYANPDELPELIAYWKQRILERDPDETFAVGIMVGVSGCGKSSMLEAGLVPALPDSVIPILIEASERDTEIRILNKLRRVIPDADLDKKWSLVDWAFRLRSGSLLPADKKVVFILDQFEQWLNAHGGETTNQLLDALHQCDGEHLQAIVCVREGFHATLMRFVESLELVLDADANYATAHRFKPDHARYVLMQFGRGLKRLDDPITEAQQAFIDATVEGLAESDRGVVCVRLVVLALVMQDRPWTVEELNSLGGLDGIGAQFLVDCFEGRTASEQYRRYLPAAMRVLSELLPAEGLEIKDVRSYDQLLAASELDKLQFDDLLNILTRKLFLLSLVEADTGTPPLATSNSPLATNFQLTHDFLVPSIREWLARKLRETKAGRAQLRLQERTTAWNSKPENRNLPSLWEWITIRRLTDRQKWKPNEKNVMRRAGRVHATRAGLLASAIAILAFLGVAVRGQVVAQQELARVEGLVAQLVIAEPAQVPDIVRQLEQVPELAEPLVTPLVQREPTSADERRSKLHAQLSTVGRDAAMVDPLVEELLTNKVAYIGPIVELLQPYGSELKDKLSGLLKDPEVESNRRFRAGVALAGFVEPSYAWDSTDLELIAKQLVSANAEYQPVLRENLRSIAEQLLVPIEVVFQEAAASDALRLGAANAVADFAANNGELITRLLVDATPEQYDVLYPLVEAARPAKGIAELERIAATLPPDDLGSVPRIAYGQRRANAAVSLLRLGEREKVLPVFDYTDDPEALTQFIFRCSPRGIGVDTLLDLLDLVSTAPAGKFPKDARYAVLLGIGEYAPTEIPSARREALVKQLADWYANDPSSGVHGAAGWLLRHLGEQEIVTRVDQTPVPYSPEREWFTLAITVTPTSPPKPKPEDKEEGSEVSEASGDESDTENTDREKPNTEPETPAETLPSKTFYYTFIVFPNGESTIGSSEDEPERDKDKLREMRHTVTLTRPFALLDREITWEELIAFKPMYAGFMQQIVSSPEAAGAGADWYDSVGFCRWLGAQMGLPESDQCYADPESLDQEQYVRDPQVTWAPRNWPLDLDKRGFRLPTESEWEVVARSGSRTAYGFGSDLALLGQFGWFQENSGKQMHPSKELRPSRRGLFDLHGNLFEWTHDWYQDYGAESATDPMVSARGSYRVNRGGSWSGTAANCRAAVRYSYAPTSRTDSLGFRLALSPSGVSGPAEPVQEAEPSGVGTEGASAEQRPEMP